MDIRSWPEDRILQLPDSAFGRRWPIIFNGFASFSDNRFYISKCGLPDRCVLWEIWTHQQSYYDTVGTKFVGYGEMELRLGDKLPVNIAEFNAYERLFPCTETSDFHSFWPLHITRLKTLYYAQGRRVVLHRLNAEVAPSNWSVVLVFSSVPTEVPDCLLSV